MSYVACYVHACKNIWRGHIFNASRLPREMLQPPFLLSTTHTKTLYVPDRFQFSQQTLAKSFPSSGDFPHVFTGHDAFEQTLFLLFSFFFSSFFFSPSSSRKEENHTDIWARGSSTPLTASVSFLTVCEGCRAETQSC